MVLLIVVMSSISAANQIARQRRTPASVLFKKSVYFGHCKVIRGKILLSLVFYILSIHSFLELVSSVVIRFLFFLRVTVVQFESQAFCPQRSAHVSVCINFRN